MDKQGISFYIIEHILYSLRHSFINSQLGYKINSMEQFKDKYLGKLIDVDGYPEDNPYQCVDLVKLYLKEKFNIQYGTFGDAINYWTDTHSSIVAKFNKILTHDVKNGDIVVLNGLPGNPYGHIGIAASKNIDGEFDLLEQNGSTGNGLGGQNDKVRIRKIDVSRIAGVLRPKTTDGFISPRPKPVTNPKQYYKIKRGDTFWGLESAWQLPHGRLQDLNPKLNPKKLRIGQKIRIK